MPVVVDRLVTSLPKIEKAIAGIRHEMRIQQHIVSLLSDPQTNKPILTLMWHGLGQLKGLEALRRAHQNKRPGVEAGPV